MQQLNFSLLPKNPFGLEYFVRHSGVGESLDLIEKRFLELTENPDRFFCFYIFGKEGSGKTHLILGLQQEFVSRGLSAERITAFRLGGNPDKYNSRIQPQTLEASAFVSRFEEIKRSGGVLFVEADSTPEQCSFDPHVKSRLMSGEILNVSYPLDEEIEPVLNSLQERWNLRLSPRNLQLLKDQLPRSPLSFARILAMINDFSWATGRSAKRPLIKESLEKISP